MTQSLTVTSSEALSDHIRMITLAAPDGAALPAYAPGAHLDFDLGPLGLRSYSLVDFTSPAAVPESFRVAVQCEAAGAGGSVAMHALAPGDKISVSLPKSDFQLHDDAAPALLLAGGIGVTPLISFATELSARDEDFALHYACRTRELCAFQGRLTPLLGDRLTCWFDDTAAIDLAALIAAASPKTHIYCCGPKGMIDAVRDLAETAGFAKTQIHFELFTAPETQSGDQPFEVEIGDGRVFTVPADQTIVEVLEEAGVDVMFDCARGDCGICQTDVLSGTPDHRDVVLSEAERAAGKVMQICVSRAKSARLVLDI